MLRDDAIRRGFILPSKEDRQRMNLSATDIREINRLHKKHKEEEAQKNGGNGND